MNLLTIDLISPAACALVTAFTARLFVQPARAIKIADFLLFILLILTTIVYHLVDSYTGRGIDDSVLFHLITGTRGLSFEVLLPIFAGVLTLATVSAAYFRAQKIKKRSFKPRLLSTTSHNIIGIAVAANLSLALIFHPAIQQSKDLIESHFPSNIPPVSNYLLPPPAHPPNKDKNLIYIYLESVEGTFLREESFPGLLKNIKSIESLSLSIKGIRQVPMTEWTIAGMTASQCGIPLASLIPNKNGLRKRDRAELPGAFCLGDWLSTSGFHLVFMGGADLSFASKGEFYTDHGFMEVMGGDHIEAYLNRSLPRSKWGVYDDDLFEAIQKKAKELHIEKQPFALFALTLDTHAPEGHETPKCIQRGISYPSDSIIEQRLACADHLVGKFFDWFVHSGLSKDTLLVIASDHLIMRNDTKVNHIHDRENLFIAYGPDIDATTIYREASTMDISPTLMTLMSNDEISGFALGRNLLGEEQTLIEKKGLDIFSLHIQGWRAQLWELWRKDSAQRSK